MQCDKSVKYLQHDPNTSLIRRKHEPAVNIIMVIKAAFTLNKHRNN